MRRYLLAIIAVASTATLMASSASHASGRFAWFGTPGEAAYCTTPTQATLVCWTPNDGFTARMTRSGRPSRTYEAANKGDNAIPPVRQTLHFGQRWRSGPFICWSKTNGLRCINARGHGWHINRYVGYTFF